jgi:hypothetical protein
VHRTARHDEDQTSDEPTTAAVVRVSFLNGGVWQLAVKTDGDIMRVTSN